MLYTDFPLRTYNFKTWDEAQAFADYYGAPNPYYLSLVPGHLVLLVNLHGWGDYKVYGAN